MFIAKQAVLGNASCEISSAQFTCPEACCTKQGFGSSGQPVASQCAPVNSQTRQAAWRGCGCWCSCRREPAGSRLCDLLPSKCLTGRRSPAELLSSASLFPQQSCGSQAAAVRPDCSEAALVLSINWNFFAVFLGSPSHAASMLLPAGVLRSMGL